MAYCSKCGKELTGTERFCRFCGNPVTKHTTSYQTKNNEQKFREYTNDQPHQSAADTDKNKREHTQQFTPKDESIEVSQSGSEHIYLDMKMPRRISYKGDTISGKVDTSCKDYTIWHPRDWTDIEFTEDGFMLIIYENLDGEERDGRITAIGTADYEVEYYKNFVQSGNPNY